MSEANPGAVGGRPPQVARMSRVERGTGTGTGGGAGVRRAIMSEDAA